MAASPSSAQIKFIVGELNAVTTKVVQKIALDVTANLQIDTPKDTGWAAANWVPSIGAPFVQTLAPVLRSDRAAAVGSAKGSQASGLASVLSYRLSSGSIFITNNVPYIGDLNRGSSKQAPAGFIEASVLKAVTTDLRGLR